MYWKTDENIVSGSFQEFTPEFLLGAMVPNSEIHVHTDFLDHSCNLWELTVF